MINLKTVFFMFAMALSVTSNADLSPRLDSPRSDLSENQYRLCGENQTCYVNSPTQVTYGADQGYGGGYTAPVWFMGQFNCDNKTFLRDPAKGLVKACFVATSNYPPPGLDTYDLVTCASENQVCNVNSRYGRTIVYYGSGQNLVAQEVSGSIVCSNNSFGVDPAYLQVKSCFISRRDSHGGPGGPGGPGLGRWQFCSSENNLCRLPNSMNRAILVRYGAQGRFITREFSSGALLNCSNSTFGRDPIDGVVKSCEFLIR